MENIIGKKFRYYTNNFIQLDQDNNKYYVTETIRGKTKKYLMSSKVVVEDTKISGKIVKVVNRFIRVKVRYSFYVDDGYYVSINGFVCKLETV